MIMITGGGGFIGSVLAARLNEDGRSDLVIVDHFGTGDKWRNIARRDFFEIVPVDGSLSGSTAWQEGRGGVSPRRRLVDDVQRRGCDGSPTT